MRNLVLALMVVGGCSKAATPVANPEFDGKWSSLTHSGAEPAYIESGSGGALVGEVRRAVGPSLNGPSPSAFAGPLPDAEVVKVIRANLTGVKSCYEVEERAGTVGSGKAIVTLQIDGSGAVAGVQIDAPAFSASKLPSCVSNRAKAWTFPKFSAAGPKTFSYPLVFVGGSGGG